jgi:acyl-[acyl-carrier-protein]-phospholipid O-acyltransferase/long-chain-fatty-acid--[acyl-carrier-protein] ligase
MARIFHPDQTQTTLFAALLAAAHEFGSDKIILEDAERTPLTFKKLVLASLVLGAKIARETERNETVGVLLPNSVGLTATLFGLNAFHRVGAILNFTAGKKQLVSALRTGQIRTVLTSRRFVEMGKLEDLIAALAEVEWKQGQKVRIVALEDLRNSIGTLDKVAGAIRAAFARALHRPSAAGPQAPAVVLFTSGTEGEPKGVVLTNANLLANAYQMLDHMSTVLGADDVAFNPLPMFHSFGLTAGTLTPLLQGVKVALYPSPLHYRQIPKFIRRNEATILFATDTFLAGYYRAAEADDLATLRYVIAGAERIKPQTRQLWSANNTEILEGYGATECSPVVAVNQPDANRAGSVGRLLPGISARLEPVSGITEGGRLFVRGPNVMAGYLLPEQPGVLVPPPGDWHDTGDIVTLDDGYLTIRGRAKRFAKIGGEMVSLAAIEGLAAGLWDDAQHVVLSLPDPRKGEQLVLVTDKHDAVKEALQAHARTEGFPELWIPKIILIVEAVPVLGSGKVDMAATQKLALKSHALQ